MSYPTKSPVYVLLHIYKCAGFSVSNHILKVYGPDEYIGLYESMGPSLENRTFITAYLRSLPKKRIRTLKVIAGHGAFYGIHRLIPRPCRYVVFLRDPHRRTISHYGYFLANTVTGFRRMPTILNRSGKPYEFAPWLKRTVPMHDYMTRFLYERILQKRIAGEVTAKQTREVIEALRAFYMVGMVERVNDHRFLYRTLGLPVVAETANKTDPSYIPSVPRDETLPYIRQDMKLYRYFIDHPNRPYGILTSWALEAQKQYEVLHNNFFS